MKINFSRIVEQVAVEHHDREALVNTERNRRYTYRQLHLLTNRIVNMMRERLQLGRGDRYLSILENDNLSLLHAWTNLKGEAAAAWTNYRDSFDEHCWQIDFIEPKVVFLESARIDRYFKVLRERDVTVVCMDRLPSRPQGLLYFDELLQGVSDANPDVENDAFQDIMIYRFTGGTTGKSKCAQYTTDNWLACRDSYYAVNEQVIDAGTRYMHMSPISHGSDMIISGGFNVYAIEVEAALNAHPAVAISVVVGRPHEEWGEAVHAEVILRDGGETSEDLLIEHVKSRIGRFKAPKTIAFVDELPLSSVGKVLRRQVRDKYWQGRSRRIS